VQGWEVFDPAAQSLSVRKTNDFVFQYFQSCALPSTKVMV